jgi:hypothetical protein
MAESYTFAGRTRVPLTKKLNPIWWFRNDLEQQLPEWYHPEWSHPRRVFYWYYLRNPLQNCRAVCGWWAFAIVALLAYLVYPPAIPVAILFIGGVQDRNYTVTGRVPVLTVQRNDLVPPEHGFQWCIIWLPVPRVFISYSGKYFVWYAGWQPHGFAGFKFNLHHE